MNRDFIDNSSGMHHSRQSRRPRQSTTRDEADCGAEERIWLTTIGRTISILDATTNPYVSHLMSEDTCWRFSHEQWVRARPSRWDREPWQHWQDDGDRLKDKLRRIEQLARGLGLPPEPAQRLRWYRRVMRSLGRVLWS